MRSLFILSVFVLLVLVSPAAVGQSWVVEPIDHDEPCFWEDDICFSYQESSTPHQPTILTCISNQGCKKCIEDDATGKMVCGTAYMENGDCKCTVTATDPRQPYVSGCQTEGSCTFKK